MSSFRSCVRRRKKKLKSIFSVSGIFPGKADSVILLGLDCIINPQNLIKLVGAIFEKIEISFFFLCELNLILRVGRKRKYGLLMFTRGHCISNLNEIDQLVQALHQDTDFFFFSFTNLSGKSR